MAEPIPTYLGTEPVERNREVVNIRMFSLPEMPPVEATETDEAAERQRRIYSRDGALEFCQTTVPEEVYNDATGTKVMFTPCQSRDGAGDCGLPVIYDVEIQNKINTILKWTKMPREIPINYLNKPEDDTATRSSTAGYYNSNIYRREAAAQANRRRRQQTADTTTTEQQPIGANMNQGTQAFWTAGKREEQILAASSTTSSTKKRKNPRRFVWQKNNGVTDTPVMPYLYKEASYFPSPLDQLGVLNNWVPEHPAFDGSLSLPGNNQSQTLNAVISTNQRANDANPAAYRPDSNLVNGRGKSWGGKWIVVDETDVDNTWSQIRYIVCFDGIAPEPDDTLPPVQNCTNDGPNGTSTCEDTSDDGSALNMTAYAIVSTFLMCVVFGGTYYKFYQCFRSKPKGGDDDSDDSDYDSDDDSEFDDSEYSRGGGRGGGQAQQTSARVPSRASNGTTGGNNNTSSARNSSGRNTNTSNNGNVNNNSSSDSRNSNQQQQRDPRKVGGRAGARRQQMSNNGRRMTTTGGGSDGGIELEGVGEMSYP